ncbi:hypothetical protein L209DRAFT_682265 [Thermothelomyces heterothallicus CBS 203.75]
MILRDLRRLTLLVGPFAVLLLLSASLWRSHTDGLRSHVDAFLDTYGPSASWSSSSSSSSSASLRKPRLTPNETHYEVFSQSTSDAEFFDIRFDEDVLTPSVIPHPKLNDTWYVVAQLPAKREKGGIDVWADEVGCLAQFYKGALMCIENTQPLPYEPTLNGNCKGNVELLNLQRGPREARVFFGPKNPWTAYGSNSAIGCYGQFIQDFRALDVLAPEWMANAAHPDFRVGSEIRRSPQSNPVQKDYFVFWDKDDAMHVHYNMFPTRGYAKLEAHGKTGPDLAGKTAKSDTKCLRRYLPKLSDKSQSIRQATNSLRVTLCSRAEAKCTPHDGNTFIMTLVQHQTDFVHHSEYEPYVVLFRQHPPFELYAVSRRPLWISGRTCREGLPVDIVSVTSVNWRDRGLNYHGYLDDVVMLAFQYGNRHSAGIDVRAGDLLVDLGLCQDSS